MIHQKLIEQKKVELSKTIWDKKIIETMNKLGYGLKDINEGLSHKDKHILETYSRLVEEKRWAEEFKKYIHS